MSHGHGLLAGQVLAGKYRVERVLGEGGMGVVVAAHHVQLDEKVALKFLLPDALNSPDAVARFLREARAAVKIKSEHVARVIDVGRLEDGAPYIVMEYLDGRDLGSWLAQHGALPVAQAVDFVLQTCEAVADAHALGIVHRDLKPANLFCVLRSDGRLSIKVLDFGISKITTPQASAHEMTNTHAIIGSPSYMSPEQMVHSKGVDARTDIWSLGVILFQLMTDRLPFNAQTLTQLAIQVANDPAPPLRALRPDAPAGLEQAVARCLEKDRSRRFQTVGELAVALGEFGSERAASSVERILGTLRNAGRPRGETALEEHLPASVSKTPPNDASWRDSDAEPRRWTRRARSVGAFSAIALLLALALAGGARLASRTPSATVLPASVTNQATPGTAPPAPSHSLPWAALDAEPAASALPAAVEKPPALGAASVSRPSPTNRAPAAPKAQPADCDPPYIVNEKGSRIFKKECL